jgi:O-antigen/teichoic acid export membrane protein
VTAERDPSPGSDALTRDELRRRASAGVFIVGSLGFVNLVVGFCGNVVLARLLLPRDFGLVALGATLMVFANALSEGGLGAGLIRREAPPARHELRALLALQLTITTTLALIAALVALLFGRAGLVVAIMMLALPTSALELPGRLMLSRTLVYRRLAVVDICSVLSYYGWAVAAVVAGFGVWGLATAAVARALTGALVMLRVSGLGILWPSFAGIRALLPVVRFGIRFQAVPFTIVVRDQLLNVGTGALGGVATLGLWSFARRLLEVPLLVFQGLWRVSFPAMSQLLAARENPAPVIQRGVALSAIAAGFVLSVSAATAPELVPAVFGEHWREAAQAMPPACLGLLIGGPISVATVGYLYAAGDPVTVLRASACVALCWLCVGLGLLPFIGVAALGVGWLASSVCDAVVLGRGTFRLCGARMLPPLRVPLAVGAAAGAAGWAVTVAGPAGLLSAALGGLTAAALQLGGLTVFRRALLMETVRAVLRSASSAIGPMRHRPRPAVEPAQP